MLLASVFPPWWSFVIGSKDANAINSGAVSLVNAFGMFWMTQYLKEALPDELIEAAASMGVDLPNLLEHRPARGAARCCHAGTVHLHRDLDNFFWPFIVLDPGNPTLPFALHQLQAR